MQFLFELLLAPILELVFYLFGYATAWLLVPAFTLGHVTVEPNRTGKSFKWKRGRSRIQRTGPGQYLMEMKLAAVIGVVFWVVLVIGICLMRQT